MSDFNHEFNDVAEFHRKFDLPTFWDDVEPHLLDDELTAFRTKFMEEELEEFKTAVAQGNLADAADALVDLVYVAMGTAHMMHLPWHELWAEVQRANMAKARAAQDGSDSKRGSAFDVVKPEGWRPPDIEGVLKRHMYRMQMPDDFDGTKRSCANCGVNMFEMALADPERSLQFLGAVYEGVRYYFCCERCVLNFELPIGC